MLQAKLPSLEQALAQIHEITKEKIKMLEGENTKSKIGKYITQIITEFTPEKTYAQSSLSLVHILVVCSLCNEDIFKDSNARSSANIEVYAGRLLKYLFDIESNETLALFVVVYKIFATYKQYLIRDYPGFFIPINATAKKLVREARIKHESFTLSETIQTSAMKARFDDMFEPEVEKQSTDTPSKGNTKPSDKEKEKAPKAKEPGPGREIDPCTGKYIITRVNDKPVVEPRGDLFEKQENPKGQLSAEDTRKALGIAIVAVNLTLRDNGIACAVRLTDKLCKEENVLKVEPTEISEFYETEWTNGLEPFLVSVMKRCGDNDKRADAKIPVQMEKEEKMGAGMEKVIKPKEENTTMMIQDVRVSASDEIDGVILAEKTIFVYHVCCMLARELYTSQKLGIMSSVSPNKFYIRAVDFQSSRGFELFVSPLGWDLTSAAQMIKDKQEAQKDTAISDNDKTEVERFFNNQYNTEYQNTCEHFNSIFAEERLGKFFTRKNESLVSSAASTAIKSFDARERNPKEKIVGMTLRDFAPTAGYNTNTKNEKDLQKLRNIWHDMAICILKITADRIPILKEETIDDHVEYTLADNELVTICRNYAKTRTLNEKITVTSHPMTPDGVNANPDEIPSIVPKQMDPDDKIPEVDLEGKRQAGKGEMVKLPYNVDSCEWIDEHTGEPMLYKVPMITSNDLEKFNPNLMPDRPATNVYYHY